MSGNDHDRHNGEHQQRKLYVGNEDYCDSANEQKTGPKQFGNTSGRYRLNNTHVGCQPRRQLPDSSVSKERDWKTSEMVIELGAHIGDYSFSGVRKKIGPQETERCLCGEKDDQKQCKSI